MPVRLCKGPESRRRVEVEHEHDRGWPRLVVFALAERPRIQARWPEGWTSNVGCEAWDLDVVERAKLPSLQEQLVERRLLLDGIAAELGWHKPLMGYRWCDAAGEDIPF